jgi:hypothetical protein
MNNLAYNSQKPDTIGPKVEELLRKEIGAPAPISYDVEGGDGKAYGVGTAIGDMGRALFGGRTDVLFNLNFSLTQPRPARLSASVERMGPLGSYVGPLFYSTTLSRPAAGEVTLEPPKTFGNSKFAGEPATAAKLNGNGDLIKRANKFARTESKTGGGTLKMDRLFKVVPQGAGALLLVATLPRITSMGFGAAVDAKDFFEIAAMVEASL